MLKGGEKGIRVPLLLIGVPQMARPAVFPAVAVYSRVQT